MMFHSAFALTGFVHRLAVLFIAFFVVVIPLGFLFISHSHVTRELAAEAETVAEAVTERIINRNPQWWELQKTRLDEYLSRRPKSGEKEIRRIVKHQGGVIAESVEPLEWPVIVGRGTLYDALVPIAELEISRSLRPLLLQTAGLTALLVLIGGVAYYYLSILPLRALQRAEQEIRQLAMTDQLTGLYNRHAFYHFLEYEISRSQRYHSPFALIVLDLDHFKRVNDQFGHDTGDAVLAELSSLLKSGLRSVDKLARWGGEELIILAPETGVKGAVMLAEKACRTVSQHPFPVGTITISIGVAEYQTDDTASSLVKRADRALYEAKEAGRNMVSVAAASVDPVPPLQANVS